MLRKSVCRKTYAYRNALITVHMSAAILMALASPSIAQTVISTPVTSTVLVPVDGGTVTVTSTGSISVSPGTLAIDANGFNSTITLSGPVSVSNPATAIINGVLQDGNTFNTLIVGLGGDITASGDASSIIFGVNQTTSSGTNSVDLEEATISVTNTDLNAIGIRQVNTSGDNSVQFGTNGRLSVDTTVTDFEITGILQLNDTGDSDIVFAAGAEIDAISANISREAFGIRQNTTGSGDVTSVFGANVQISASAAVFASGIEQTSDDGMVSATFGANGVITATGAFPLGVRQRAPDARFELGEGSIINVNAGLTARGIAQEFIGGSPQTSQILLKANSLVNVVSSGSAAVGITSFARGPGPSFLTLEPGAEVFASSSNSTTAVQLSGDNFQMVNSGRITATSTNATPNSRGVFVNGDSNSLVNHGAIIADLADTSSSIRVLGDDNMVSLLTFPVIQGRIVFDGLTNTLLIGSGFDAVYTVAADLDELTIQGQGQTLIVKEIGPNLYQVITVGAEGDGNDTSFDGLFRSSSIRMSDDLVRFLQQHINTRSIQNRQFLYQDNGLLQDFWFDASGFGQHSTTGSAYSHGLGAFTIGYDRALEDNGLGGIYGGYSIGSVNTGNPTWENMLQTAYAGAYYDRNFNRILTGINLLGGFNWDDAKRRYMDNMAPGGIVTGKNNGTGFLISPEVSVGYEIPYRSLSIIPSVSGRYTYLHQGSYNEGIADGLTLSQLNRHQMNIRLELTGVGFNALNQDATRWSTILRGGLDVYANWHNDVRATVAGVSVPYTLDDNPVGIRPFVGADVEYRLTDRARLDFGLEGAYDTIDAVFGSINAGFSVLF